MQEFEKGNSTFVIDEGRGCLQVTPGRENEAKNSTFGLNCAGPYDMVILIPEFSGRRICLLLRLGLPGQERRSV